MIWFENAYIPLRGTYLYCHGVGIFFLGILKLPWKQLFLRKACDKCVNLHAYANVLFSSWKGRPQSAFLPINGKRVNLHAYAEFYITGANLYNKKIFHYQLIY